MWEVSPTLNAYDVVDRPSNPLIGFKQLAAVKPKSIQQGTQGAFTLPVDNFYRTDPISRSSVTMAKCTVSRQFVNLSVQNIC